MKYNRELKIELCQKICINKNSTIYTAKEYNVPLKTLEKWITAYNKDNHCFDPIIETVTDIKLINNINNFYKNEKDLRLQKFPRHISMINIYYLLIKCNIFEKLIELKSNEILNTPQKILMVALVFQ